MDKDKDKSSHSFLHNLIKHIKFGSNKERSNEAEIKQMAAQEQKVFSYETLVAATKNFSALNKLGEGGFGPVYKGKLSDGREVAVKKLSHTSNQGKKEFMNEAKLLARVQHRNVVNLLGYCAHGGEKLLVYEYVPHESLDKLLFKVHKRGELDWKRRLGIITGVAKGLLYLHEDCHHCIIHRDIKASNILLDDKWQPKIADFGMARLFPEDQSQVNTRVAGTNGYMAPEYVMHGQLSAKADVFSYGVLVLELISGQRNSNFNLDVDAQNLLDWTYKLHKKGRNLEIVDSVLASTMEAEQVAMCIQLGLLCTQGDPKLRPDMRRVVVMLSRKPGHMEEPTRPGVPGSRYRRRPRQHTGLSSATPGTSGASDSQTSDSSSNTTSVTATSATTPTATRTRTRTNSGVAESSDSRGKRPMEEG
ncbi:putative receptor-like protein kinase At4g00960 [Arachis ipaensis]|uniref:cysteine-rich receptor-like protein kinase 43 n=1 Tax=Arachis hypogaea TaxID=3818 RepID=UPI0007AF104D|nr:putative receptor-like protein kinase At4g00960 [Arachis ipaensis]XP_025639978.1 putative receptor-like protein kinase At4g00960 [Arachis hypogaea]QHO60227.1 Cysteine-rich receptor-like protein kinase [Arachis hypogaea]